MKLLTIATSVLLGSTFAAVNIEQRDEGGPMPICLYMTTDYDWKGEGNNFCQVGGQCGSGLGTHMSKNVSSAGPPQGQTCFLYDDVNCNGNGSEPIVYPGYMNLSDPRINFDKRAQSWRCWKHCGYVSSSSSASKTEPTSTVAISSPAPSAFTAAASSTMSALAVHSTLSTTRTPVVPITGTIPTEQPMLTTTIIHTEANHGVTVITDTMLSPSKRSAAP